MLRNFMWMFCFQVDLFVYLCCEVPCCSCANYCCNCPLSSGVADRLTVWRAVGYAEFILLNITIEPSDVTQQNDATEAYAACIFQGPRCGGPYSDSFGGRDLLKSKLCEIINVPRSCCSRSVIRTIRRGGPDYPWTLTTEGKICFIQGCW